MAMLLQVVGTILGAGVFAYGIVFMIIGWASGSGPNIYEFFFAAPEVLAHPWFLPMWGGAIVIFGAVALIDRVRRRP